MNNKNFLKLTQKINNKIDVEQPQNIFIIFIQQVKLCNLILKN